MARDNTIIIIIREDAYGYTEHKDHPGRDFR